MNAEIATTWSRLAMDVLRDSPPPVPQKGVPLPSVLRSKQRKVKIEILRYIKGRLRQGLDVVVGDRRLEAVPAWRMKRERRRAR